MSARTNKSQINLLPAKGLAATSAGRVLIWALTTFRVIVIVTEIIVMIAFFSRFALDAKNTDLNELLQQKQAVIASSSELEKEFRDVQKRIEIFSSLIAKEGMDTKVLDAIRKHIPNDTILSSISVSGDKINIKGISPSEKSIQQFMVNLESDELFIKTALSELEASGRNQSLLLFSMSVSISTKNQKT